MRKVVLDNNVIISGLINPDGTAGKILELAFKEAFQVISSEHLLEELRRSLGYARVQKALKKIGWKENDIRDFLRNLRTVCEITPSVPLSENICEDPDDDWVISCAEQGEAEVIVSGDKKLIQVEIYKQIQILKPFEFLSKLVN